jgi:hypothetical protein
MKTVLLASAILGALSCVVPTEVHAEGLAARSAAALRGSNGAAGRRGGIQADGQGNAVGGRQRAVATESGAAGASSRGFRRSSDGSLNAGSQANARGANGGTAQTSSSFSRSADGTASGERSTSVTNANTGVTYDGSASYDKESGFSRSGSCRDASGTTVSCGSR